MIRGHDVTSISDKFAFCIMTKIDQNNIQRFTLLLIGGLVSCRSVKLLEGELEDNKTLRESWWEELRKEIRSHARCLGCNLVVGKRKKLINYID